MSEGSIVRVRAWVMLKFERGLFDYFPTHLVLSENPEPINSSHLHDDDDDDDDDASSRSSVHISTNAGLDIDIEEDVRGLTIPSENEHLLCLTLIIETIMVFAN